MFWIQYSKNKTFYKSQTWLMGRHISSSIFAIVEFSSLQLAYMQYSGYMRIHRIWYSDYVTSFVLMWGTSSNYSYLILLKNLADEQVTEHIFVETRCLIKVSESHWFPPTFLSATVAHWQMIYSFLINKRESSNKNTYLSHRVTVHLCIKSITKGQMISE